MLFVFFVEGEPRSATLHALGLSKNLAKDGADAATKASTCSGTCAGACVGARVGACAGACVGACVGVCAGRQHAGHSGLARPEPRQPPLPLLL